MLTRSRQLHFVITTPAALSTNPQPASAHRLPSAKHPFWFSSILPPLRPSVSPEEEEEEEAALALLACRFLEFFCFVPFRILLQQSSTNYFTHSIHTTLLSFLSTHYDK